MDATDEHVRAYRIADNRLGEISNWDDAALVEELESLDGMLDTTLTGFDMGELQAMLSPTEDAAPDGEDSADEYKTRPPTRLPGLETCGCLETTVCSAGIALMMPRSVA